jgi:hypothetical protein
MTDSKLEQAKRLKEAINELEGKVDVLKNYHASIIRIGFDDRDGRLIRSGMTSVAVFDCEFDDDIQSLRKIVLEKFESRLKILKQEFEGL